MTPGTTGRSWFRTPADRKALDTSCILPAMPPFPASAIAEGIRWGNYIGEEWVQEYPTQLHESMRAPDGTPQWSADFARWLSDSPSDDGRDRAKQVMRKLRRVAPRAFEVCYQALILGKSFREITAWLNERAVRNGIELPEDRNVHYVEKDAVAIFLSGISFAREHY